MAKILVIDDEHSVRNVLRATLTLSGHQVYEASNGHEGIDVYRQQQPDVVVCDLFMPGKAGLATIRELRLFLGHDKIIAISGAGHDSYFQGCLELAEALGGCKTLAKPFTRDAILSAIDELTVA